MEVLTEIAVTAAFVVLIVVVVGGLAVSLYKAILGE